MVGPSAIAVDVLASGRPRRRGRARRRRDFALLAGLLAAGLAAGGVLASRAVQAAPSRLHPGALRPASPGSKTMWAPYRFTWADAHPSPDLGITAAAGILVDVDTHTVLWERGARTRRAPASLTKMVTAMVALDSASPDTVLTVPPSATDVTPNLMDLVPGERVSVRDLLYGLFLVSGNDAAETLAQAIMPRPLFIGLMNAKARALGLRDTTFTNPTGLDDPGLRSTPYDLAMIAGYLEHSYPLLDQIAATRDQFIPATEGHKAYEPINLNKLLDQYAGATGLKTGLTDEAGGCLAGSATRDGHHLVSIILGSDVFFTDSEALLDYGFSVVG